MTIICFHSTLYNIRIEQYINFLFFIILFIFCLVKHANTILLAMGIIMLTRNECMFTTLHTFNLAHTGCCNWKKFAQLEIFVHTGH